MEQEQQQILSHHRHPGGASYSYFHTTTTTTMNHHHHRHPPSPGALFECVAQQDYDGILHILASEGVRVLQSQCTWQQHQGKRCALRQNAHMSRCVARYLPSASLDQRRQDSPLRIITQVIVWKKTTDMHVEANYLMRTRHSFFVCLLCRIQTRLRRQTVLQRFSHTTNSLYCRVVLFSLLF